MKQIEKLKNCYLHSGYNCNEHYLKINQLIENQNEIINTLNSRTSSGLPTKEEMRFSDLPGKHEVQKSALDELNELLTNKDLTIVLCDRVGVRMDDIKPLIQSAITELTDEIIKLKKYSIKLQKDELKTELYFLKDAIISKDKQHEIVFRLDKIINKL